MDAKGDAVAVIAVHGVGGPTAGAMTKEIAGLLQSSTGVYTDFKESLLELRVSEIGSDDAAESTPKRGSKTPWFVRTRMVSAQASSERKLEETPDIAFTREAVTGARVDETFSQYRSVVLSGERRTRRGSQRVDVYEMYWADLSHLGGWIGRVMGEFYQILFHLANIGQKTVELAWLRSDKEEKARLEPVLASQAIAEGMLAVALPLFNLALILAILPMSTVFVSNAVIRAALCGAVVACMLGYILSKSTWRKKISIDSDHSVSQSQGWELIASVLLAAGLGIAIGYLVYQAGTSRARTLLFLIFAAAALAIYVFFARALLRRRRKGAQPPRVVNRIAIGIWMVLLLAGLYRFPMADAHDEIRIALFIGEGLFLAIGIAWFLFIVAGWATFAFGFRASKYTVEESTRAAIWTGKIGLVIPAALFFLVSVVAWHLVYEFFLSKVMHGVGYTQSLLSGFSLGSFERMSCGTVSRATDCVMKLLAIASGPAFSLFVLIVLLAIGLLLVALLPSILYESKPLWRGEGKITEADEESSAALGNWLDSGWVVLRGAGYIFAGAILLVVPGLQLWEATYGTDFLDKLGLGRNTLLPWLGGAVVGGTGVALILRDVLSKGLTRAIGILFDVDNWLKELPIEQNPRGRILLRYIALLRYVWNAGYKRVVIVSHSQGTVITADLLRFLDYQPQLIGAREEEAGRIRLMTFGSPLRQLYGLRFPDLYGWARAQPVMRGKVKVMPISQSYPNREALFGVQRWINCYRSGDYVGRFLWTSEGQWKPSVAPPEGTSTEFCLVAGAHTHYFDRTALVVGKVIDREIVDPDVSEARLRASGDVRVVVGQVPAGGVSR